MKKQYITNHLRVILTTLDNDERLIKHIRFLLAVAELNSALQRFGNKVDAIFGRENDSAYKALVEIIESKVDIPIHEIASMTDATSRLQEAWEQLQRHIQQRFEIQNNSIVVDVQRLNNISKSLCPNQKFPRIKTLGRPIPAIQLNSVWKRTRSNPKLR